MGYLTMSTLELDRLQILQRVAERRLTQAAAAQSLGLSYRQVKRLMARFRRQGAAGLVSRKRGQRGNRRLPSVYTELIVDLVREHYSDFGPTLAREKLLERHGLLIGRETLRGLMRNAGLWQTRAARRKAVQQPRARRQYFGELIQIDGSEHRVRACTHWFRPAAPTKSSPMRICVGCSLNYQPRRLLPTLKRFCPGTSSNIGIVGTRRSLVMAGKSQ
jgi:transposase